MKKDYSVEFLAGQNEIEDTLSLINALTPVVFLSFFSDRHRWHACFL